MTDQKFNGNEMLEALLLTELDGATSDDMIEVIEIETLTDSTSSEIFSSGKVR
jgi:hypothetical protein